MIQFLWSNIYISHLQVNEKFSSNVPLEKEKENLIPVEIGILISNADDFTYLFSKMVFCYQNCSDLLFEKIILLIKKNF